MRATPSIEPMTSTWLPLVTMSLTCVTWVGMSSLANWRLTLYPAASSVAFMYSPSLIQRSELLVGIATPMVPLLPLPALGPS